MSATSRAFLVAAVSAAVAVSPAHAQKKYGPGASDTQIKVGQTTKAQVEALLGEPLDYRRTEHAGSNREWWAYELASSTINPLEYLFIYGFWTNGVGLFDTRHDLHVFFDASGVVRSFSLQTTSYDMSSPLRALLVTSTAARFHISVKGDDMAAISAPMPGPIRTRCSQALANGRRSTRSTRSSIPPAR